MDIQTFPNLLPILLSEYQKWGCPKCGFSNHWAVGNRKYQLSSIIVYCSECHCPTLVMHDQKPQALYLAIHYQVYAPQHTAHPRTDTPKHGYYDYHPTQGGEFFIPLRISREFSLHQNKQCFVCQRMLYYYNKLHALVTSFEATERLVTALSFGGNSNKQDLKTDYWMIEICACWRHRESLIELQESTKNKNVLTQAIINDARLYGLLIA